ncbi:MAG: sulfotransferase family 2 domain-containing protein [Deltaproteobacteria bacterium]|nr:sulfotransferase family 2 domain-containing protein [Deltaproteobacteria bacterium]
MLISHRYRCILSHIPKCAGTSMKSALDLDFIVPPYWHCTWKEACEVLGEDIMQGYFKFAFVRDPWDRVISAWKMFEQKPWCRQEVPTLREFLEIVTDGSIGYRATHRTNEELDVWQHSTENIRHHTLPCLHPYYGMVDDDGRIKVNFVGRYEELGRDFQTVCEHLGFSGLTLPIENPTEHRHYSRYYDNECVEIVHRYYGDDIVCFQYQFDRKS